MNSANPSQDPRIVIVGAGPAGLSTAYYLRKNGYSNVIVLEKLGRVGGMAHTITAGDRSFDLGANYVTPAYKETLKMAEEVGAKLYSERPFVGMQVPDDVAKPVSYETIFDALRVDRKTGKPVPVLRFMRAILKFVWLRFKLRSVIDRPTFAHVEDYNEGELCTTLLAWLEKHDLECIATLFDLPITMMGYGYVNQTAAVYALKFMTLRTFIPMVLKETPIVGPFVPWPKRFVLGYQRLWERLSWNLDVRFNIDIQHIERQDGRITVHFRHPDQIVDRLNEVDEVLEADYLILACPLTQNVLPRMIDLSQAEQHLFRDVKINAYCMTTYHVKNLAIGGKVTGAGPLAAAFYFHETGDPPELPLWKPWGVAKQWPDSDFVQYYTRVPWDFDNPPSPEEVRVQVIDQVHKLTEQMGGQIMAETKAWHTFNIWPYFQHITPERMKAGFYTELEALQGQQNTFYAGGVTNFELIEPIAQFAKNLVAKHFPARR